MHFTKIIPLSLSAFVSAHPAEEYSRPPKSPRTSTLICPASTPFTTIYVTTISTVVTTYATITLPTTATLARSCPTYYTEVGTPAPWASCTFNTKTCTTLDCLYLKTITMPCQMTIDPCCTRTATDTLYRDCPTKCPSGCGTSWTMVSGSCGTPTAVPTFTATPLKL
ncbi:hypothetical protein V2W45_104638 [Cenococcum geophilum]